MDRRSNKVPAPLALALLFIALSGLSAAFGRRAPGFDLRLRTAGVAPSPAGLTRRRGLRSRLAGAIVHGRMVLHARLWLANGLIGAGVLLLAGSTGLYAYGLYERYLFEQQPVVEYVESEAVPVEPAAELPAVRFEPVETVAPAEEAAETVEALPDGLPEDRWQIVPIRPEPPLRFPPPTRIVIPSIKVDSRVIAAKIVGDTWEVPKFVVGHLQGTGVPGQIGNAAFSGHVESLSSGNVFAELEDVKKGDEIVLYLGNTSRRYQVTELKVVRNTDVSIVAPTSDERITLITCTGTWLPLARDYDRRRIVIAKPVDALDGLLPPWVSARSGS